MEIPSRPLVPSQSMALKLTSPPKSRIWKHVFDVGVRVGIGVGVGLSEVARSTTLRRQNHREGGKPRLNQLVQY